MVLTESQLDWEKDWFQRFYEALESKDKDRVSPFLHADVEMIVTSQVDVVTVEFDGRENVARMLTNKSGLMRDHQIVTTTLDFNHESQRIVHRYDSTFMGVKFPYLAFLPYRDRTTMILHKCLGREEEEVSRVEVYAHLLERIMPAKGHEVNEQHSTTGGEAIDLSILIQAGEKIVELSSSVRQPSSAEMLFR